MAKKLTEFSQLDFTSRFRRIRVLIGNSRGGRAARDREEEARFAGDLAMLSEAQNLWLQVESVGDVTVVRFTIPWILKEGTIEAIGETLYQLVETGRCRKFVLNFGNVKSLASTMFGKLTALHQKVEAAGGRLVFCQLDPSLREIFEAVHLVPLLPVFADEQEAVQGF